LGGVKIIKLSIGAFVILIYSNSASGGTVIIAASGKKYFKFYVSNRVINLLLKNAHRFSK